MTQEAMKLALGQLQAGFVGNAMQILREALAENAMREVQRIGQEIEQEPVELCQYEQETASCTSNPMHCLCAIDAALAQPEQEQDPALLLNNLALTIASDAISYRELVWNLSKKVVGVAMSAELVKGQANRVQVTAEAMSNLRRFVEKGVIERLAFYDKNFDAHHAAAWKLYAAPQPTPFYATPPQRTEEKNT